MKASLMSKSKQKVAQYLGEAHASESAQRALESTLCTPNSTESLTMSQVTITIDEQDLPTVLEILREKGIAVAEPEHGRWVGGEVGEADASPEGRDVGGSVGHIDD